MKTLATILIIAALLWCCVPESPADLNSWYSGAQLNLTNGLSVSSTITITNGSSGSDLVINGNSANTWLVNSVVGGVSAGGVTNTGAFMAPNGSTSIAAYGFAADSSMGFYRPGTLTIDMLLGGVRVFDWTSLGRMALGGTSASISFGGTDSTSTDLVLARDSAATLRLGANAASVVTPQTLTAADGTGTDHNGASLQLQAGQSTGAGVPGDLIYRTSLYTNGSGSTANAYLVRGQIVGRPCALTNNTATSFQRFTMATNTQVGINLFCTARAVDAAFARQSVSARILVDAVNVNGTITASINSTTNTTATSSGTLALAITVVDEGSNVLAIRANANTSLTATPSIKWIITGINSDGAITVTPVQL